MVDDIIKRLQRIDQLIREENTGQPALLAKTIGVSERTIYEDLKLMKKIGAPIEFCSDTQSYHYTTEGSLIVGFVEKRKDHTGKEIYLNDKYILHL